MHMIVMRLETVVSNALVDDDLFYIAWVGIASSAVEIGLGLGASRARRPARRGITAMRLNRHISSR